MFYFRDRDDGIGFGYHQTLSTERYLYRKGKPIINLEALSLYGFFRDAVYNSYSEKNLARDIRVRKGEIYQEDLLYDYAICACVEAISKWQNVTNNIQSYIAYNMAGGKKEKVGFVYFYENIIEGRSVVYIAQAGVKVRGQGIGRRLMQCVLSHFQAGQEFYVLTRAFNTDAKILYQDRLCFQPIETDEIKQLNYDERYCGFKHTTMQDKVDAIISNKINFHSVTCCP